MDETDEKGEMDEKTEKNEKNEKNKKRVILVSGGARGLGLKITHTLLHAGYGVSAFGRRCTPEIEELSKNFGDQLLWLTGDLQDQAALTKVVAETERSLGAIDGLVNNAGIAGDGLLALTPPDSIERVVGVNLVGTLMLTRLVVRRMLPRSRGCVVNISSIVGSRGYAGLAVYAATKAGIDGMTRALARELGPRNIRVNSVAPGYLETEMTGGLAADQMGQIIRRTPLSRLGTVEDVSGVVAFLLSDAAAFITGQVIVVDGGITC